MRPILFIGDIHLGRTPHRLVPLDLDLAQLRPAESSSTRTMSALSTIPPQSLSWPSQLSSDRHLLRVTRYSLHSIH